MMGRAYGVHADLQHLVWNWQLGTANIELSEEHAAAGVEAGKISGVGW